jgi:hypothetical protein
MNKTNFMCVDYNSQERHPKDEFAFGGHSSPTGKLLNFSTGGLTVIFGMLATMIITHGFLHWF